jgi:hypothetical protein
MKIPLAAMLPRLVNASGCKQAVSTSLCCLLARNRAKSVLPGYYVNNNHASHSKRVAEKLQNCRGIARVSREGRRNGCRSVALAA